MRKRWYFPKKEENLFSNRRWTNQSPWRRSTPEHIHLDTGTSNSRRKSWLVSGCPWSDKWLLVHVRKLHLPPSRWTQSQAILAERRIIPNSTEVHWRIQNYTYEFGCQARETHRWLLEYRWVKRFVWLLDRFHSIHFLEEKPPNGYMWSGERLTRKQLSSRQDRLWPELWKKMGKNAKLKEQQRWSNEELRLDNARNPRGRSLCGKMARLPCRDCLKGTCTNSFCERMLVLQVTTIGLRIPGYEAPKSIFGRAQTYGNRSDV